MVLIIIASVLLVIGFVWSYMTTSPNLSGFYGFKYLLIAIVALVAIATMYIYGILYLI